MKIKNYLTHKNLIILSLAILVLVMLIDVNPSSRQSFIPISPGMILLVSASIFLLYIACHYREARVFAYSIFIFFSIIPKMYFSSEIEKCQIEKSKIVGMEIVTNLQHYFRINKKYPKTLVKLVPKIIEKIPTTSMGMFGTRFRYELDEKGGFFLFFMLSDGYMCFITSENKNWIVEH